MIAAVANGNVSQLHSNGDRNDFCQQMIYQNLDIILEEMTAVQVARSRYISKLLQHAQSDILTKDPTAANLLLVETLIKGGDPNWYNLLIKALNNTGFNKLAAKLDCSHIKDDKIFKALILDCLGDLTKCINNPLHLLPDLVKKPGTGQRQRDSIISVPDSEEITCAHDRHGPSRAVHELILRLPKRQEGWMLAFVKALQKQNCTVALTILDGRFTLEQSDRSLMSLMTKIETENASSDNDSSIQLKLGVPVSDDGTAISEQSYIVEVADDVTRPKLLAANTTGCAVDSSLCDGSYQMQYADEDKVDNGNNKAKSVNSTIQNGNSVKMSAAGNVTNSNTATGFTDTYHKQSEQSERRKYKGVLQTLNLVSDDCSSRTGSTSTAIVSLKTDSQLDRSTISNSSVMNASSPVTDSSSDSSSSLLIDDFRSKPCKTDGQSSTNMLSEKKPSTSPKSVPIPANIPVITVEQTSPKGAGSGAKERDVELVLDTIHIKGLSSNVTEDEIRHGFSIVGKVKKVNVSKKSPSKTEAIVAYASNELANNAIKIFNDSDFKGVPIKVTIARNRRKHRKSKLETSRASIDSGDFFVSTDGSIRVQILDIMAKIEDNMKSFQKLDEMEKEVPNLKCRLQSMPADRGDDSYGSWVAELRKLAHMVYEQTSRDLFKACLRHLAVYHKAIKKFNENGATNEALGILEKELMSQPSQATDKWLSLLLEGLFEAH